MHVTVQAQTNMQSGLDALLLRCVARARPGSCTVGLPGSGCGESGINCSELALRLLLIIHGSNVA